MAARFWKVKSPYEEARDAVITKFFEIKKLTPEIREFFNRNAKNLITLSYLVLLLDKDSTLDDFRKNLGKCKITTGSLDTSSDPSIIDTGIEYAKILSNLLINEETIKALRKRINNNFYLDENKNIVFVESPPHYPKP